MRTQMRLAARYRRPTCYLAHDITAPPGRRCQEEIEAGKNGQHKWHCDVDVLPCQPSIAFGASETQVPAQESLAS